MTSPTSSPRWRRLGIALLVLLIVIAAFAWLTRAKPVKVLVSPITTGTVEATVANTRAGTVEACQRTKLSTIMGGRIEYLGVKEGDKVKKGQLLMKLWNDDQQAQSALAETQIALSRRRVSEACIIAESAEREATRQSALRAKGFISEGREDTARTEARARRAACDTAKADVAQAEARFRSTKVEQGRTSLYAPFDGTIAKISGELGEYSTPSPPGVPTPPAIDLIDDSCLYVSAPMDEVDAPRVKPGQVARITLDALPKQVFAGKVRRVAPYVLAVEKQARTVDVDIDFAQPENASGLLVGYSADVEILLESRENVLRIPTAAIQEGGRVLILKDGKLTEAKIKAGLANWEYTEVLEGLSAGDQIVTSLERDGVKAGAKAIVDDGKK